MAHVGGDGLVPSHNLGVGRQRRRVLAALGSPATLGWVRGGGWVGGGNGRVEAAGEALAAGKHSSIRCLRKLALL